MFQQRVKRFASFMLGAAIMATAGLQAHAEQLAPVPEIVALLPESIKASGVLRIAMPDQGKPFAYKEGNELKGMDLDLAKAMTEVMGLKSEITLIPFNAAMAGLQANKFDISFGDFYITAERLKVVNFVTNWKTFGTYLVKADGDLMPKKDSDICGLKAAAMTGSTDIIALEKATTECGDKSIQIEAFPGNTAVAALLSGRVDVIRLDRGIAAEVEGSHPSLTSSGQLSVNLCGIAIALNDNAEAISLAVEAALKHLIASGAYIKALEPHGLDYGAIAADEVAIYSEKSGPPSPQ